MHVRDFDEVKASFTPVPSFCLSIRGVKTFYDRTRLHCRRRVPPACARSGQRIVKERAEGLPARTGRPGDGKSPVAAVPAVPGPAVPGPGLAAASLFLGQCPRFASPDADC